MKKLLKMKIIIIVKKIIGLKRITEMRVILRLFDKLRLDENKEPSLFHVGVCEGVSRRDNPG